MSSNLRDTVSMGQNPAFSPSTFQTTAISIATDGRARSVQLTGECASPQAASSRSCAVSTPSAPILTDMRRFPNAVGASGMPIVPAPSIDARDPELPKLANRNPCRHFRIGADIRTATSPRSADAPMRCRTSKRFLALARQDRFPPQSASAAQIARTSASRLIAYSSPQQTAASQAVDACAAMS